MSEEEVIVHRIGTLFLGGPPLVKAATGEEVSPEDLGGVRLDSEYAVSYFGCIFLYLVPRDSAQVEEPLYNMDDLMGLAPHCYNHSMDVRQVKTRCIVMVPPSSLGFCYAGQTLLCIFKLIFLFHQIGIVANNGELTHEASLKGSHFVQLCDQRDIPLMFLQNTAPEHAHTISQAKVHRKTFIC
uniref:Acetyl-coenzyme A carboxylase carboxyl transferase subunit beta domain-containing protein n=1 Tax=Sinocyclocheilus grahami TaxID=75366 RepID=A0A672KV71_SINGR